MKQIPVFYKDEVKDYALVDDDMFDYLSQFHWIYLPPREKNNSSAYARYWTGKSFISMHYLVAGEGYDHKDRNGLNNQRDNLRKATPSQNAANCLPRGMWKTKGVKRQNRKWIARITVNQKYIHLGTYDDFNDAAKAYNEAATKYFGEFALLNKI